MEETIVGGYAQVGMFFSEVWGGVPEPMELALKYAMVDPDGGDEDGIEREFILAANWFFKGHRNKLSADISRIVRQEVRTMKPKHVSAFNGMCRFNVVCVTKGNGSGF